MGFGKSEPVGKMASLPTNAPPSVSSTAFYFIGNAIFPNGLQCVLTLPDNIGAYRSHYDSHFGAQPVTSGVSGKCFFYRGRGETPKQISSDGLQR